jgi:alpha-2-macroglobulin
MKSPFIGKNIRTFASLTFGTMKTLPFKKITVGVLILAVIGLTFFYFYPAKSDKTVLTSVNPAFGEHISFYTAGVISSTSPVRVMLAKSAVDSSFIGKETDVKLFSFSPSVKGKTIWVDSKTVEFHPNERFSSGQTYSVDFKLSRVVENLPKELYSFEYSLQIIPQNFDFTVDNIRPYEKNDLKRQKIEGTLLTADVAEAESVEKMFTSSQEGTSLKVSWIHSNEGKQHNFQIEDVARKEEPGKVNIRVDAKPLGVDRAHDEEVDIPSLSDFKLMNARVVQTPTQHVLLQFSDPLMEKQNLDGLITIDGLESLDFSIADNQILIYPAVRQSGAKKVNIAAGIRNILDYKMKDGISAEVVFEQVSPAVRFTGKGSILPGTDGLVMPFEAVNLNAVDVTIFRIYESNILQFLQVNNIDGSNELFRVGQKVLKKTVPLGSSGITDQGKWNRYTLDLAQFLQAEPGAIYQLKISFKKSYSTYQCDEGTSEEEDNQFADEENDEYDYNRYRGYDDYYEDEYYYDGDYDWEQRDNPCHSSYYTGNRAIKKNILASDLGISAKRGGDGTTIIYITDIKACAPLQGVQIDLYNYQQQGIGSGVTDVDGKLEVRTDENPFALIAKNGQQRGYLKLGDGDALAVSSFEVAGESVQKGLKGFLYGDRGVWRPGDSLYLTFILQDKLKQFPSNHPVVFELQDPQGQLVSRIVRSSSENGFYSFATSTRHDAPTGNWMGRVKAGGLNLSQTLKIETVKPNRLKINLDFGTDKFTDPEISGDLDVKWLHGAPGKNMKSEFEITLASVPTKFAKYDEYVFEDPTRQFSSEQQDPLEVYTNEEGKARVNATLPSSTAAPGFINVIFRGKVYEESGNFSIDRFAIPYYPYSSFVGMKVPEGEKYSGILYFDKPHNVDLVTLDTNGKGVTRENLEVSMYKLSWRWWWDNSYESVANFVDGSYSKLVKQAKTRTINGKGTWSFEMKSDKDEYGRYFIRVCDPSSGHCSGQIVYIDEPGWYSRVRDEETGGANILTFGTDKTVYNIGEQVNVSIPTNNQGRALISLENGSSVLRSWWVETQKGETKVSFEATTDMAPNIYVHVTMLQPHAQTTNDMPIRQYGVTGITVQDPATHLEPVVKMPEEIQPGQEVTIKVSEKSDRKMTYTVAVVDEGLLDITRFKTPDAWNRFYSKEALGVRTWDLYDHVMGAFGARLERVLSVGGDDYASKEEDPRANRFKPVVRFFGPFTMEGGTAEHKFVMPQYIGSVKTMVVAGFEGAYGKAETVTPVRKPLMVLATLPRVLGPEENVRLPITLFTQDKKIQNVNIEIKTSGPLSVSETRRQVSMPSSGDLTVDFALDVRPETGVGKVTVNVSSGNFKATDEIEIEIRNPNVPVTKISEAIVEAGKSWSGDVVPFGISGTNSATLEVSSLPPVNLGSRLRYLIQYPYGCVEQTTSSVFPQLYLDKIKVLTEIEKSSIQRNVTSGIERLRLFQRADGGFSYWPGMENSDSWGTTYAGHFLVEAESRGYFVPSDVIRKWKKYQKNKASEWRRADKYYNSDLMQAYRLYTLALSGAAEIGAMNRLQEDNALSSTAAWMLAAAYAKAGQPEAARKIISGLSTIVKPYRELSYTYGSDMRDRALILETLTLLNEKTKAFEVLKEVSKALGESGYWMSTQETAMCLRAVGNFAGMEKRGDIKFTYGLNGKNVSASTELPIAQVAIPINGTKGQNLRMTNSGGGMLYLRLITEGTPARGNEEDGQNNLSLSIRYTDVKGAEVDVTKLEQGTEFLAEVTVTHTGLRANYENLALSQVFPSGWEINNLRLTDDQGLSKTSGYNYQDIRDDRVYTYFDLSPNQRKTFKVLLTATYSGTYYLPAVNCEAMYDKSIYARKKGYVVEVVKPVAP